MLPRFFKIQTNQVVLEDDQDFQAKNYSLKQFNLTVLIFVLTKTRVQFVLPLCAQDWLLINLSQTIHKKMIKDWIQIQPKHFRWLHQLYYPLPKSNNHLVK